MKQMINPETNLPLQEEVIFQHLPANSPALMVVVRYPDLKLLFVNPQFEHYLGYSNSEIESPEGVNFSDILEEHQHALLLNHLANLGTRNPYVIYHLRSKKGNIITVYAIASPLEDENSEEEKRFVLQLHPDLSRRELPFTSFDSKDLFLEQFSDEMFGTFEWIPEADVVYMSAGLYRIFEMEGAPKEISAAFADQVLHPGDAARVRNSVKDSMDTAAPFNTEFRIITAKDNIRQVRCVAKLIKDVNGKPIKIAGSIRDITEKREIENDIKSKVEELNRSNRELEEFAYIASHDLQEPLRKITTFSDRLTEKYKSALTGDGLMYLDRMVAATVNMRNLINDLLEFSRIAKSEQPFKPVPLNEILQQSLFDLELSIEDTKTSIRADELPVIDGNATQMKQLFSNILSNAIKFRKPDEAPVIRIEASKLMDSEKARHGLPKNNSYYQVSISDNGIGFEQEYAVRIFQVFQRLHGKSEYKGTGIGLAICKKIVEFHKGIIYAEGIPGVGSTFVFILPEKQDKGNRQEI